MKTFKAILNEAVWAVLLACAGAFYAVFMVVNALAETAVDIWEAVRNGN